MAPCTGGQGSGRSRGTTSAAFFPIIQNAGAKSSSSVVAPGKRCFSYAAIRQRLRRHLAFLVVQLTENNAYRHGGRTLDFPRTAVGRPTLAEGHNSSRIFILFCALTGSRLQHRLSPRFSLTFYTRRATPDQSSAELGNISSTFTCFATGT